MKCSICGNDTSPLYDTQFDCTYHKCHYCQLIQLDPNHKISFDQERRIYDTHQNSLENQGYVDFFKNFLKKGVLPYKKEGHLLDYGSGPEPVLVQLINRDYGFMTDHYDLHYAPEQIYQNKYYDVIVSTEVIEHVDHPVDMLSLLEQHLANDGIISLMTLFHSNDDDTFLKWWYRRDETHITFYTPKTLEVLASLCQLKLLYHDNKRIATFGKIK